MIVVCVMLIGLVTLLLNKKLLGILRIIQGLRMCISSIHLHLHVSWHNIQGRKGFTADDDKDIQHQHSNSNKNSNKKILPSTKLKLVEC